MTLRSLLAGLALLAGTFAPAPARADGLSNVSAYCDVGTMADGAWTHWGAAGGASWLPFGSLVEVPGYGVVVIEDRGAVGAYTIDLAMPGDCADAWAWGRQWLPLRVIRFGWGWGGD